MSNFFGILLLICFIMLIVGLVKPKAAIKWGDIEKRTRVRVLLYYGIGLFVLLIAIGATAPKTDSSPKALTASAKDDTQNNVSSDAKAKADADAKAKADAEAKAKADAEAKAKAEADAKAAEDAAKHPKWNTAEVYIDKNGNMGLALNMLKAIGDISQQEITTADAGDVFKAPWNYYGKTVKFSGTVGIVQDFPPGSDTAKAGVNSEVVIVADYGTYIDLASTVSSGKIKVGNHIDVIAYPVGLVNVNNKMGGQTDELALITNKL